MTDATTAEARLAALGDRPAAARQARHQPRPGGPHRQPRLPLRARPGPGPDGTVPAGKVGRDFTEAEGAQIARSVGLGLLSSLRDEIGSLDQRHAGREGPGHGQLPARVHHPAQGHRRLLGPVRRGLRPGDRAPRAIRRRHGQPAARLPGRDRGHRRSRAGPLRVEASRDMPQLIGYVSDEAHVAIEGAFLEFIRGARRGAGERRGAFARQRRRLRRSRARRAGPSLLASPATPASSPTSRSRRACAPSGSGCSPDRLLGYAWPKWVAAGRAGRAAHARRGAVLGHALALRLGEGAGRGPRPVRLVRARRRPPDRARRGLRLDRLPVEPQRLPVRAGRAQRHHGPGSARLLLRPHDGAIGRVLQLPADRRAARGRGDRRRRRPREHDGLERLQRLRRPLELRRRRRAAARARGQRPPGSRRTCATRAAAGGAARRRLRAALIRPPRARQPDRSRGDDHDADVAHRLRARRAGDLAARRLARARGHRVPTSTPRTSSTRACSTSTATRS